MKPALPTALPADDAAPRPRSRADLFWTFTWLALQGFGGVLAVVQRELVEKKRWLTREQFLEEWAVAQIMPGPNVVNLAVVVGKRYGGLPGAIVAPFGLLAGPFAIVLLLALLYDHFGGLPQVQSMLRGIAAVGCGLLFMRNLYTLSTHYHRYDRFLDSTAWAAIASVLSYAVLDRVTADWVGAIIDTLEFIGGVPRLLVPDQPRALIARPDRYEPTSHRLLDELCAHYGLAVLPARPAKPRDKPKVEVAVQVVERWILARLRNERFFSLAALNRAIAALVLDLNQRPFKKLPGCRASAFAELDRPALRALPATRQTALPTSSATSRPPFLSMVTPTGRPGFEKRRALTSNSVMILWKSGLQHCKWHGSTRTCTGWPANTPDTVSGGTFRTACTSFAKAVLPKTSATACATSSR